MLASSLFPGVKQTDFMGGKGTPGERTALTPASAGWERAGLEGEHELKSP